MKTVVITGSARGLGLEMAKLFKKNSYNVVISDINEENLLNAYDIVNDVKSSSSIISVACDVTNYDELVDMINTVDKEFGSIDIWINNAGVNQPNNTIWALSKEEIELVLNVDLKGTIMASKLIVEYMNKKKSGAIYNVEGYGSNDAMMTGLSIYGTSKRAITYFTQALAKECDDKKTDVIIGRLSPGIMITDFLTNSLGDKEEIELPEKTKKVYNILGDYPDVVADFLVKSMIENTKNNAHIVWLTNRKAAWRFMTSVFRKRNFFK